MYICRAARARARTSPGDMSNTSLAVAFLHFPGAAAREFIGSFYLLLAVYIYMCVVYYDAVHSGLGALTLTCVR